MTAVILYLVFVVLDVWLIQKHLNDPWKSIAMLLSFLPVAQHAIFVIMLVMHFLKGSKSNGKD